MGRPVPIRPTPPDQKTAARIPGPSPVPGETYWRQLERDAVGYAARTLYVDEPSLTEALSEDDAVRLRRSYERLRTLLPNTRLILTAEPATFCRDSMPLAVRLPVDALYLDLIARPKLMVEALALAPVGLELVVPEGAS
jgi:hypothetical protein